MTFVEELRALKREKERARIEAPHLYPALAQRLWGMVSEGRRPGEAPSEQVEPVKRSKRKLTIAGITKQAAKAGLTVVRVDFDRDGRVAGIVTGKQPGDAIEDDATPEQRSRWH
jgi:hypothetical protein